MAEIGVPTPHEIYALRTGRLNENRKRFGRRFYVGARTIESWEQWTPDGYPRRRPQGLVLIKLRARLRRT